MKKDLGAEPGGAPLSPDCAQHRKMPDASNMLAEAQYYSIIESSSGWPYGARPRARVTQDKISHEIVKIEITMVS